MFTCLDFKAVVLDRSQCGKMNLTGDEQTSPRLSPVPRNHLRAQPDPLGRAGEAEMGTYEPFPSQSALPSSTSNSLGADKHLAARPRCVSMAWAHGWFPPFEVLCSEMVS